jgi:hypothetical protein
MELLTFLTSCIFSTFNVLAAIIGAIFGITIFISYLLYTHHNYGILQSISISYYAWTWPNSIIFQQFMWSSAFCILLITQTWWYLIVALLFTLMTFFPSVLYKDFIKPHCTFAISAIVLALIGLPFHYGAWMCILLGVCMVADILILKFVTQKPAIDFHDGCKTTKTYWVEVVSLSTFLLGVILGVLTL